MSAVVKTITPFINKEMLLQALDCVNCKYTVSGNTIVTERTDYRGNQTFILTKGKFVFQHDSDQFLWSAFNKNNSVSKFLEIVENEYNRIYAEKLAALEQLSQERLAEQEKIRLEEELKRIEQERIAYVESQKQAIIQKAKEQGYSVQEKKVNNKIKLILHRNTY